MSNSGVNTAREVPGGVAGLDATGHLYSTRMPAYLAQATLDARYLNQPGVSYSYNGGTWTDTTGFAGGYSGGSW